MSNTLNLKVTPKQIDSSNNETDLDEYTITATYDGHTDYHTTAATDANKVITLPVLSNHYTIELISDQKVEFVILTSGTATITMTDVKNVIINWGTGVNYTYTVKNISGSIAEIEWKVYA